MLKLLKGHMCLEVSAIAMIDLDDHIFGSQDRLYQGIPVVVSGDVMALCLMYIAAISSGPGRSPRSRRLLRFALIMTPQGLLYGSEVIKGRWFEAATPACAWDCAFPPRSCIPLFARRSAHQFSSES